MSATPAPDGIYTTTVVCGPRTGKAAGEADYRHIHWNQRGGSRVVGGTTYTEAARGKRTPANNEATNTVHLTVRSGVVFDADGMVDMRSFNVDGAVRLISGTHATVVIENGAVLNVNRTPAYWSATDSGRPNDGTENWYPAWWDSLIDQSAIVSRGQYGDITVTHGGVINFNIRKRGRYTGGISNGNAINVHMIDTFASAPGVRHWDILIELKATGVIQHVAGSHGGNGIKAQQDNEQGHIAIDLAEGSLIDVSGEGGRGVYAHVRAPHSTYTRDVDGNRRVTGNLSINAGGTVKAAVRGVSLINNHQGTGIVARSGSTGTVRVVVPGVVETVQATGIDMRPDGAVNTHTDDTSTPAIEGHAVDITGDGRVETRGGTAIYTRTRSANASLVVRVAEDATVRARALTQEDYDNGAITRERLGTDGHRYVRPGHAEVYGWRNVWIVRRDENGRPAGLAARWEPVVSAIVVTRAGAPAAGVTDRVIVEGTVETIDDSESDDTVWVVGSEDDPAIRMERGGAVTVGSNGVVRAASGLAILAGVAPPAQPRPGYTAPESDLDVTVEGGGRIEGVIRIVDAGDLTIAIMAGGAVTGTLHDPQTPFEIGDRVGIGRLLYSGGATVTVARGGKLTGVEIDGAVEAIRGEAGNLDVTIAAGGEATGNIEGRGAGNLDVTVAGELTGSIAERGAGDLDVRVTGTVTGGVRGEGGGDHTVEVAAGGAVTGAVHLPTGALTVLGDSSIGSVRYDNGGRVTVHGEITGVETEAAAGAGRAAAGAEHGGATEAIRGDAGNLDVDIAADGDVTGNIEDRGAGNLDVAVAGEMTGDIVERGAGDLEVAVTGTVTGDIRAEGAGAHEVEVESAGTVTGTVRLPENGAVTVKGRVGRVRYDNGGAVTVDANGEITGIEIDGAREAIRSDAGDLTVAVHGAVKGNIDGRGDGDLTVTVSPAGTVTGNIDGRGDGDLTVTVSPAGTVTGEIVGRGGGVHTIDIADEATVLGTVHNPKRGTTIHGVAGRVLFDNGGALTIAATGRIAGIGGEAILSRAGDLEVAVAGKATGRVESRGGALAATVTGTVEGDILGLGDGEHTVAIRDGGMVTGTVRLAASEVDVDHGAAGRVLLDRGGSVKVGARGRIAGLEIEGAREAIRADAGNLEVAVASGGAVAGRIEERGAGDLTATVAGEVSGGIRGMGAGRHTIAIAAGGAVTGVETPDGGREAIRSAEGGLTVDVAAMGTVTGDIRGGGALDVDVSGTVKGGIFGLGVGAHDVHVKSGGSVEGLIHLAASDVTVDGAAASVRFDRGGTVAVGSAGRISGLEGRAVHSAAGNLTVEVNGVVMGSVSGAGAGNLTVAIANALTGDIVGGGGGVHRLTVRPGAVLKGNVRGVEFIRVAGRAEGTLNVPRGNEVTIPEGGRLIGAEDAQGRRVAIIAETGALRLIANGAVAGAVEARDTDAASTVTVGGDGDIAGRVALAGAGSRVGVDGKAESIDIAGGTVTVGEDGRIEVETSGHGRMTIRSTADESDTEALGRVARIGERIVVCIRRPGEEGICFRSPGGGNGGGPDGGNGRQPVGPDGQPPVGPDGQPPVGPDGQPPVGPDGQPLVGPDGQPLVGPDGQPLVGPDGQPLVGPDGRPLVAIGPDGRPIFARLEPHHRVYAALPSALLALNALPAHGGRRASAPRGAFARIDAGVGDRRPEPVTAETRHDYRRFVFEAGMEGAVGERGVFAVSVHHVRGRADVETDVGTDNGGRVEIAGTGARISGAWFLGGGYRVGAQAVATLYEADLDSTRDGALARDVSGRGYAAGVEVGRRLELGRVTLTPRAGADWSMVELSSFTDSLDERVSLDAGRRIAARAGVRAESGVFADGGGVFATLDVERELSGAMRATAAKRAFETDAEATWARFGLGAAHEWAGGRVALRAAANYAAARRGNRDFSGSATLTVRF